MQVGSVKSSMEFIKEIEKLVKEKNMEYFEAVLLYCERNQIEIETIAAVIKQNSTLKAKIQIEAENINMMKRTSARLPI
ncbi:Phage late-transcription coactivator [uncultured Caudovirales phage]|uniref:Phage late-transcription coactivator n=1 Tax=uncultured Caudovirales phage TaxID=2100421 RepID=A0A6J7WTN7_9CAUD|nr:Phage late-transcription coactivator [uncultured Caudovirales phage]